MKDEIKEILEIHIKANCELLPKNQKKVLDCITNLQEENERVSNLYQTYEEANGLWIKKYEDYKSRCEKAIEYINKNKHLSMFADCREPEEDWNYELEINPRELLNILQGEDK